MSTVASNGSDVIVCAGCERKFAWKPQLAGKRVKCKCGQAISVPAATAARSATGADKPTSVKTVAAVKKLTAPAVKPVVKKPVAADDPLDLDGLAALADDAERAAAAMPMEIRDVPDPVIPLKSTRAKPGLMIPGRANPLGYQRGPTARDKQLAGSLVDPVRDIYAPTGILAAGFILYIAYFIVRFHLPSAAVTSVGMGVVILTSIKAALLVGFALMAATPLGVSFGQLSHAILKLGAIAVITDGVTAWVDMGVSKVYGGAAGGGIVTWGIIGWPVAIGMYWGLLIYLFSMDPGESWLVVVCLSVFDRIMRVVLLLLLLGTFLSWGGVSLPSTVPGGSSRHSASVKNSVLSTHVDEVKERDGFIEARKYIADGHQPVLRNATEEWYAAGCPNVWFEMTGRDINGRRSAMNVIVELPDNKAARAKCYATLQEYYKQAQIPADPSELVDDGEQYLNVMMR
jgi:hypothetical protein